MKKTLVASLVAVSLGVASVAAAADLSGFAGKGSGFYVGGNIGYSQADWSPIVSPATADKNGMTYGLNVGYMFNANVGMEVAYDMYHDSKVSVDGVEVATIKSQHYPSVLSVWNIPVNNQWNVFAKVGGTYLSPKLDFVAGGSASTYPSVWAPTMALGAGYNLTQNLNLNTQFKYIRKVVDVEKTSGDASNPVTPNYTALTVGINYKF